MIKTHLDPLVLGFTITMLSCKISSHGEEWPTPPSPGQEEEEFMHFIFSPTGSGCKASSWWNVSSLLFFPGKKIKFITMFLFSSERKVHQISSLEEKVIIPIFSERRKAQYHTVMCFVWRKRAIIYLFLERERHLKYKNFCSEKLGYLNFYQFFLLFLKQVKKLVFSKKIKLIYSTFFYGYK